MFRALVILAAVLGSSEALFKGPAKKAAPAPVKGKVAAPVKKVAVKKVAVKNVAAVKKVAAPAKAVAQSKNIGDFASALGAQPPLGLITYQIVHNFTNIIIYIF